MYNGDTQRPLLTVKEASARLNVSEKTVRRLIERKQLPAFKVGSLIRIDADALVFLLNGSETEIRLKRQILGALDRDDQEELKRLQAEYQRTAVLTRSRPE